MSLTIKDKEQIAGLEINSDAKMDVLLDVIFTEVVDQPYHHATYLALCRLLPCCFEKIREISGVNFIESIRKKCLEEVLADTYDSVDFQSIQMEISTSEGSHMNIRNNLTQMMHDAVSKRDKIMKFIADLYLEDLADINLMICLIARLLREGKDELRIRNTRLLGEAKRITKYNCVECLCNVICKVGSKLEKEARYDESCNTLKTLSHYFAELIQVSRLGDHNEKCSIMQVLLLREKGWQKENDFSYLEKISCRLEAKRIRQRFYGRLNIYQT
ncbi:eukaryotic translation initiation factor 4 gamma 3-like isoform X6 [Leptotrombidium deliense]|uniref:Eukaryotic translation initiation factor 4 gamma 3-like isoform X6 n=1 Tax=Leptotrombidium deliense TaxID=299467 RepID=A0A443S2X4_9ACAR|nr:eukaryotic translation initiation factor 4 gamma 3-like isoform X6 [Leptotrombidium deliense]